jgi:cysteine-rich repeat protein
MELLLRIWLAGCYFILVGELTDYVGYVFTVGIDDDFVLGGILSRFLVTMWIVEHSLRVKLNFCVCLLPGFVIGEYFHIFDFLNFSLRNSCDFLSLFVSILHVRSLPSNEIRLFVIVSPIYRYFIGSVGFLSFVSNLSLITFSVLEVFNHFLGLNLVNHYLALPTYMLFLILFMIISQNLAVLMVFIKFCFTLPVLIGGFTYIFSDLTRFRRLFCVILISVIWFLVCATSINSRTRQMCSNGVIEEPETCDDRNLRNNDGCNKLCQIEPGWSCIRQPSTCAEIVIPRPAFKVPGPEFLI